MMTLMKSMNMKIMMKTHESAENDENEHDETDEKKYHDESEES